MADLNQKQWREQLQNDPQAVILDVRTDEEVEEGFIPGAVHMDIQNPTEFYKDAQALDSSKNYYVYCRSGGRSGQACALLGALGIKNAYNLEGGISEWKGELTK